MFPDPEFAEPSYAMSNEPRYKDLPDRLCPMCRKLDLEDILNPDTFGGLLPWNAQDAAPWFKYIRPIYKFTLPGANDYAHHCTFCFFLRQLASRIEKLPVPRADPRHSDFPDGDGFVLAAAPAGLVYPDDAPPDIRLEADRSSVFLLVLPGNNVLERLAHEMRFIKVTTKWLVNVAVHHAKNSGTLICRPANMAAGPSVEYRAINVHNPDYAHIRSWIDTCLSTHEACRRRAAEVPVPRMRVIDCASWTIVKHKPGRPYAALSYVWGTGPADPYVYPNLSDRVPDVIKDAITVTKKLGIPYLWVDRYCIWQDDPTQSHKMEQINAMGQIYGDAIVTIVSTEGGDSYGISGVGSGRSLYEQITGRSRDLRLVADYGWQAQDLVLSRSKWQTRGWTFQEWILSSRVIVFSSYRISYECAGMQCIEQLNCPIGLNKERPQRPQHDNLYRPEGAVAFLTSFAKRQLTYDTDGLNAMAGILQIWTASNPGAAHLMGVPVILPPPESSTAETLFRAVWAGLAWRTADSLVVRSTRRAGMPTWSHVGVKGARFLTDIRADTGHLPRRKETAVLKLEGGMSLEMKDGSVHSLEDFVQAGMHKTDGCRSIAALHLTGWCFTPRSFVKKDGKDYLQVAVGSLEHLLRFVPDIAAIELDKAPGGKFLAVSPYSAKESYCAIVCERSDEDGVLRRVGRLTLYHETPGEEGFINVKETLEARWDTIWLV